MPGAASVTPPFIAPFRVVRASGGDDYAVLQSTIDACIADGRKLYIFGKLKLGTGAVAAGPVNIESMGGPYVSGFMPLNSGADGITLLKFTSAGYFASVRNCGYWSSNGTFNSNAVPKTAGYAVEIAGNIGTTVEGCQFSGQYDCIGTTGGAQNGSQIVNLINNSFWSYSHRAVALLGSAAVRITNASAYNSGGAPPTGTVALYWQSRDELIVNGFSSVNAETGLKVVPISETPASTGTGAGVFNAVYMDTGGIGFDLDSNGETLGLLRFTDCWAGYNLTAGVKLRTAVKGFRWTGGFVMGNDGPGFDIGSGCIDGAVQGALIGGNAGPGIKLASGVVDWQIQDNRAADRNFGYGGKNTQTYGIEFGGSHTGLLVTDNDLRNNATGPVTGDYSGASNRVHDNPGLNPKGAVGPPTIPASTTAYTNAYAHDCTVYVAGGTVTAIAIGGTATGMTSGMFRVPAGQTITLTYSSAPTWTWFGD